ncbi:MAG: hypothetical protein GY772_18165 [bacterium]|nr:hypothetical protein [bacterium]
MAASGLRASAARGLRASGAAAAAFGGVQRRRKVGADTIERPGLGRGAEVHGPR